MVDGWWFFLALICLPLFMDYWGNEELVLVDSSLLGQDKQNYGKAGLKRNCELGDLIHHNGSCWSCTQWGALVLSIWPCWQHMLVPFYTKVRLHWLWINGEKIFCQFWWSNPKVPIQHLCVFKYSKCLYWHLNFTGTKFLFLQTNLSLFFCFNFLSKEAK